MASFGQYLKHERETRGISLREISDSTRITIRYLEALEADRLELIPRQFFVRAIIRSYAKAVGLEEDKVLGKFDNKLEFGEQLEYRAAAVEAAPDRTGFPGWARALIAALAIIAAGALIYLFVLSPRKPGETKAKPAVTSPAAATMESQPAAVAVDAADEAAPAPVTPTPVTEDAPDATLTPAPAAPQSQSPPLEELSGLVLAATFSAKTWLRVTADGVQVFEGIKQPGDTLAVKAQQEMVLSTGNAGGMDFTLNGRPARPLGKPGVVMTDIRLNPDNFKAFLATEPAH
jgi:cytoskeleton protein RodZ